MAVLALTLALLILAAAVLIAALVVLLSWLRQDRTLRRMQRDMAERQARNPSGQGRRA